MRIQTYVRWAGARFVAFQIAFYRVTPDAPADYLLTKLSGTLPSGTVETFFRNGFWFNDLMSFAGRETHLRNNRPFTVEEAMKELAKWRKEKERLGLGTELEFMDGRIKPYSQHAFRLLGIGNHKDAFDYLALHASGDVSEGKLSEMECVDLVQKRFGLSDREVMAAYEYWRTH